MTLLPCSECCGCDACSEEVPPARLAISIEYPDGGGEIVAADEENDPPAWGVVTTDCRLHDGLAGAAYAVLDNPGTGYTSAPSTKVSSGDAVFGCAIESSLASVSLASGGSGYTSRPTVSLSGGVSLRPAALRAEVAGAITSITVTNGGLGYTSAPTVSAADGAGLSAAAVMSGYVFKVNVTDGGSGYTSTPTVSIPGGATAFATVQGGKVTSVAVGLAGTGYATAPAVSFSGGGGSGATAVAELRFRVASVTVSAGGSGYPLGAAVTLSGGGGSGAAATCKISGSVTAVTVLDGGLYRNARWSSGVEFPLWPTVVFSGGGGTGAAGTPTFAETGISDVYIVSSSRVYEAAPTVSFASGGAAATIFLDREDEHEIVRPIVNCSTLVGISFCTSTDSEDYPEVPCGGCGGQPVPTEFEPDDIYRYGEFISWVVSTSTAPSTGGAPSSRLVTLTTPLADFDRLFPGEAMHVYESKEWSADYIAGGPPDFAWIPGPSLQREEAVWLGRLYSRIAPVGSYQLRPGDQPDSATNAVLTPQYRQMDDITTQPFWYIESFTVTSGGDNLQIFDFQADQPIVIAPAPGNNFASQLEITVDFTATYTPPVVAGLLLGATFSVLPEFALTFSPSGVTDGDFVLSDIEVTSPGATEAEDGVYLLTVEALSHGYAPPYFPYSFPTMSFTVSDGEVVAAAIVTAGQLRGGASIASITLEPDPEVSDNRRQQAGRSGFLTAVAYSEPTVTAEAPGSPDPAEFLVTLTEDTDSNGNPFWYVSDITIVDAGSGYTSAVGLDFIVALPHGVEAIPAVATTTLAPREEPTLEVAGDGDFTITYSTSGDDWTIDDIAIVDGGTTYEYGTLLAFDLGTDDVVVAPASVTVYTILAEPTITASVPGGAGAALTVTLQSAGSFWEIASVAIDSAGSGYTDGTEVEFSGGDQPFSGAYALISVDGTGAITAVNVFVTGQFYDDTGEADSLVISYGGLYHKQPSYIDGVTLQSGGKYFDREIVETDDPLPPVQCVGEVSEENNWVYLRYKKTTAGDVIDVDGEFTATAQTGCWTGGSTTGITLNRTRRCPLPTLTYRLEQ